MDANLLLKDLTPNPLTLGVGVTTLPAAGTLGVFTAPVTGLASGTGYSYKAYARSAVGTHYTTVQTFTTLAVPTATAPTSVPPSSGRRIATAGSGPGRRSRSRSPRGATC